MFAKFGIYIPQYFKIKKIFIIWTIEYFYRTVYWYTLDLYCLWCGSLINGVPSAQFHPFVTISHGENKIASERGDIATLPILFIAMLRYHFVIVFLYSPSSLSIWSIVYHFILVFLYILSILSLVFLFSLRARG